MNSAKVSKPFQIQNKLHAHETSKHHGNALIQHCKTHQHWNLDIEIWKVALHPSLRLTDVAKAFHLSNPRFVRRARISVANSSIIAQVRFLKAVLMLCKLHKPLAGAEAFASDESKIRLWKSSNDWSGASKATYKSKMMFTEICWIRTECRNNKKKSHAYYVALQDKIPSPFFIIIRRPWKQYVFESVYTKCQARATSTMFPCNRRWLTFPVLSNDLASEVSRGAESSSYHILLAKRTLLLYWPDGPPNSIDGICQPMCVKIFIGSYSVVSIHLDTWKPNVKTKTC